MKSNEMIKKIASTLCALTLFFLPSILSAAAQGAPAQPALWTARQAVIFALQNSPDSRIAAQRITAAGAMREQARSAFHPRLNLSAAYGQTNNPMYSFGNILNQGNFTNDIDFNNPGRTDNLNMKAEILYRFYNGGRDTAGQEVADSGYSASESNRLTTEHRLGFEVVRAFLNIVQAQEQTDARQAEFEAIDASLKVATARYEAGDLLKADMLNFEVQKARASENMIISNHQTELAGKIFLNLLGLEEGEVNIDPDAEIIQHIPPSTEYLQRPEIVSLAASLAAAEADLAKAEGSRYPTLDGFASYQYDQGYVIDGSGDSWGAGLRLNYNLYDGKQVSAEIARKRADYQIVREQLTKLQLGVNLEIQEAELNYRQALERSTVTEKMVQVARESALLSRERFEEGVILSSDLIDTELRLTDALVRQSAARTNYRIAIANVRRVAGQQQFTATTEELLENQP
jgi:outer membrane protein